MGKETLAIDFQGKTVSGPGKPFHLTSLADTEARERCGLKSTRLSDLMEMKVSTDIIIEAIEESQRKWDEERPLLDPLLTSLGLSPEVGKVILDNSARWMEKRAVDECRELVEIVETQEDGRTGRIELPSNGTVISCGYVAKAAEKEVIDSIVFPHKLIMLKQAKGSDNGKFSVSKATQAFLAARVNMGSERAMLELSTDISQSNGDRMTDLKLLRELAIRNAIIQGFELVSAYNNTLLVNSYNYRWEVFSNSMIMWADGQGLDKVKLGRTLQGVLKIMRYTPVDGNGQTYLNLFHQEVPVGAEAQAVIGWMNKYFPDQMNGFK